MIFICHFDINPLNYVEIRHIEDLLKFGDVVVIPSTISQYTEKLLPLEERVELFECYKFFGKVIVYTDFDKRFNYSEESDFMFKLKCFMEDFDLNIDDVSISFTERQMASIPVSPSKNEFYKYNYYRYCYAFVDTKKYFVKSSTYRVVNQFTVDFLFQQRSRYLKHDLFPQQVLNKIKEKYGQIDQLKKYIGES